MKTPETRVIWEDYEISPEEAQKEKDSYMDNLLWQIKFLKRELQRIKQQPLNLERSKCRCVEPGEDGYETAEIPIRHIPMEKSPWLDLLKIQ